MALLQGLTSLFHDPPPDYVFEVTEAGIAYARPSAGLQPVFHPLDEGTLLVSPLADNVQKPAILAERVRTIVGPSAGRRRGKAVLILPDFCARVAILEFDSFPTDAREQLSLVRFRMKKSVPFDVEAAVVGFHPLAARAGKRKGIDVVVVAASLEIVARYEAPFRAAGLHPGFVTTSALATLELLQEPGITVLARLTGRLLTVSVIGAGGLKLVRCVELASASHDEIVSVLFPTIAYVEDEMASRPARLMLCGFGRDAEDITWQQELDVPVETLRSSFGVPDQHNAGLYGYLESLVSAGIKVAGAKVA